MRGDGVEIYSEFCNTTKKRSAKREQIFEQNLFWSGFGVEAYAEPRESKSPRDICRGGFLTKICLS